MSKPKAKASASLWQIFRVHYVSIVITVVYVVNSLAFLLPEHYSYYALQTTWRAFASFILGTSYTYIAAISLAITTKWLAAAFIFIVSFLFGFFVEVIWQANALGKLILVVLAIPNWFFGVFLIQNSAIAVECDKQFQAGEEIFKLQPFEERGFDTYYTTFLLSSTDGEKWKQERKLETVPYNTELTCSNFLGNENAVILLHNRNLLTRTAEGIGWHEFNMTMLGLACRIQDVKFENSQRGNIEIDCTYWHKATNQYSDQSDTLSTTDGGQTWSLIDAEQSDGE